jgi:hypothetical protein
VAGATATKLALKVQQVKPLKTVRPRRAASRVKHRDQASLARLVHLEQFQSLQKLKLPLRKTLSFQIHRAKARWQARKQLMPPWCVSHRSVTHAQPLPTLLPPQNQPQQQPTLKQSQKVETVVAANVGVVIVASRPNAVATIR